MKNKLKALMQRVYTTIIHDCIALGVFTLLFLFWMQVTHADFIIQIPTVEHFSVHNKK